MIMSFLGLLFFSTKQSKSFNHDNTPTNYSAGVKSIAD